MAHLNLTYFGTFQATLDKQPIKNFRGTNVQGLLVYLSLQPDRVISRREIADLLWPGDPNALKNLRQTLLQLHKMLGDKGKSAQPFIVTTTKTLQFNQDSPHRLDVTDFRHAVVESKWEQAVEHYDEELLPDLVCESNDFEIWLREQREAFHQQAFDALSRLTEQHLTTAEFAKAESRARQQLEKNEWHEPAVKQLMHALAAQGQRVEAMRQYERFADWLGEEFGTKPSTDLNSLYDQIEKGTFDPPHPVQQATPFQAEAVPAHFVARNDEILDILTMFTTDPTTESGIRVAALVGMGGAGKTTLAANIAHALRGKFAHGVLWANTTISSAYDILAVWGRAYGYDFSGLSDIESRATAVRGMLAKRSALIVLDNVEDAADVRPLLPNTPNCPFLITTRNLEVAAALNAHAVTIGELSAENGLQLLQAIVGNERVQAEPDAAAELCQLLHNLPLAVEIAAQVLKTQPSRPLSSMATRLEKAKHRLDLNISDLAVRTSFAVSWDALDEELQRVFALAGVFEGRPFSMDAIAYLAASDPIDVEEELYTLTSLSLLIDEEDQYFRQHPLLADFALEQLVQKNEAYARMVDYYLTFAQEKKENYEQLEPEWRNLNAAIEVAHRLKKWEQVIAFTDLLEQQWQTRGRYSDARSAYRLANAAAEELDDDKLLARLLLNWGVACVEQGDYEEADRLLTKSLRLAYNFEEGEPIADAQYHLGRVAMEQGDYERSRKSLDECEEIRRELADPLKLAEAYYMQGWWFYENGFQLNEAERLGEKALEIQKEVGIANHKIPTLQLLAQVAAMQANLDSALEFAEEAKSLCEENKDIAELAATLYVFTQIYRLRNEYTNANRVGHHSVKLLRHLGLKRIEGMTLHQLSAMEYDRSNNDLAIELSIKSAAIFRQIDDPLNYTHSLWLLGRIHKNRNEVDKSRELWIEAIEIAEKLNNLDLQRTIQLSLDDLST